MDKCQELWAYLNTAQSEQIYLIHLLRDDDTKRRDYMRRLEELVVLVRRFQEIIKHREICREYMHASLLKGSGSRIKLLSSLLSYRKFTFEGIILF